MGRSISFRAVAVVMALALVGSALAAPLIEPTIAVCEGGDTIELTIDEVRCVCIFLIY